MHVKDFEKEKRFVSFFSLQERKKWQDVFILSHSFHLTTETRKKKRENLYICISRYVNILYPNFKEMYKSLTSFFFLFSLAVFKVKPHYHLIIMNHHTSTVKKAVYTESSQSAKYLF